MVGPDRIQVFLHALRRRLVMRAALRTAALGVGALLVALLGLALLAAAFGPAEFWRPVTTGTVALGSVLAAAFGLWRPWRAMRDDAQAARAVARLNPALGGLSDDLVSAVELGPLAQASTGAASLISTPLIAAFRDGLSETLAPLDPKHLVSMRPVAKGALAAGIPAIALIAAAQLWPNVVGKGLATLLHRPSRFEGAAVSTIPIVGDLRITYEYPSYTGLPPRTVEGWTGDVIAVKGTRVKIETTPLRRVRGALLLLGEAGEAGEIAVRLLKGTMTAHLTLTESGSYRFWLQPIIGRAVRDDRSHRLEAELDRPPRVEIHGPADRLELVTPRPIEVGFAADDDFGLGLVELVFRVDDGPEHRQLLKDPHGARLAEGRTVWDPSRLPLAPGARIAYHVEARDRDEVSGAKVGSSRTLYLVIARPQETIEARLDHQREILERFIADLADRLEATGTDERVAAPPEARRAAHATLRENEEGHLTQLGRLLDEDRRAGTLGKSLRTALAGVADRLGKLLREEKDLLGKRTLNGHKLQTLDGRHVTELEKDVLLIDDLIGRQRLDDLASIGKELTDAHRRLQDLFARYSATNDEALRRQLEREIRNLRARIGELAQKVAEIKSRNDVGEEWQNMPDTRALAEQAKRLDDLLTQGDSKALGHALEDLGKDLQSLKQQLDDNAEGFGGERFPQENRAVAEMVKKIGELEGDERALGGETKALSEQQEAQAEKRLRGKLAEWTKAENDKLERLRQKLGDVRVGSPGSALSDEVERARESARQTKRLLAERDLAEAKDEADRAVSSLDRLGEHLDGDGAPGRKPNEARDKARASAARTAAEAQALAQEISDDIRAFLPTPDETLSPQDRERANGQGERQSAIGDRTDEAARDAAGKGLGSVPGLDHAADDLKGAAQQMREAARHLRRGETKQASGAQQNAAERLAKLRDSLQDRSNGGGSKQRDPVRIPGADESNAPRAWRQDLMDAMKEKAPEHFRDDVRRYYEELVR